ncbi:Tau-tubulin kinase 1 [Dirofilaria immitis]|nr:Tau-tubulin kinase 1 [Dirofilaria immitis]
MGTVFWGEIEENAENICGVIDYDKHAFFITCTEDDPVDREYTLHQVYDDKAPDTIMHMLIARHDKANDRKNTAIHRTVKILEMVKGRSMIFGENGDQDAERDPEWIGRPCAILEYHASMLGSLLSLSPTGTIPLDLALLIMIGCVRALASLHRLGYVHRLVSPYSFAFRNPISYDTIESRMLIIDLSLVLPWPCKPRAFVPFVGTMRYSSVRAHRGREQGPSDDIISLIYMIAEMISGKLPWRSIFDEKRICDMKCLFYRNIEFKRLPREIRSLYRLMYMTLSPYPIDYKFIIEQIQAALNRRYPTSKHELPSWLALPIAEE